MSELVGQEQLLDVITGEVLEPTPPNAVRAIAAAREMKDRLQLVIVHATAVLRAESERIGTKTFRTDTGKVQLSGGPSTEVDALELAELLREAGCPEERIDQAVKTEITYKVDRSVLRQLASANPDYAAAIELATRRTEKPYSAKVER